MDRICWFIRNLWTSLSRCCSDSKAVDVVEPFVPPLDLDSEPDSDPDHSGVEPDHGKSAVIIVLNSIIVLFSTKDILRLVFREY